MTRALHLLVRAFPRAFREQFAADMVAQIERDYARAQSRGVGATMWFVVATAFDLLRSGIAERLYPTWRTGGPAPAEGRDMLDDLVRDLRHAGRSLLRSPGFTAVSVGTLALAIGANAGMFSVVNTVLLHPLPYAEPDRLVWIGATAPGSDFPPEFGVSNEFYVQYKEQSRLLEDLSTFNSFTSTLRTEDRVERIRMSWPTNSLYSTLGARPMLGRLPVADDGTNAVVISHALWTSWFGGDSAVIGRTYDVSGARRTVIGIMGPEFRFPNDETMLWISWNMPLTDITPGRFGTGLVGRLRPGATPEALAGELTTLASRLPERFGGSANYARLITQHRALVRPLEQQILGSVSRSLWVLLGAVSVVLLIACANVANLVMVRAEGRQRELAVRRAIGAARLQLVRLQISESLVVAGLAAGFALVLAYATLPLFLRASPPGIFRIADARLDVATVLFTMAAAVVAALVCGVVPAFRASAPDLARLREGGRGMTRGHRWMRHGLVAVQTSLGLVLLIGSGLLMRSFRHLQGVNPGYDTNNVFTFQFAPEQQALMDGPSWAQFHTDFMDRLRALPGVESVGLVENVPLNEGTALGPFRTEDMVADQDGGKRLRFTFAAGDYYRAMGIRVLAGRTFQAADHRLGPHSVVISRSAAELLWPGVEAVGRRLQQGGDSVWHTVIGVVADVRQNDFRETPDATLYYPMVGPSPRSWWLSSPAYVIRTPRAESIAPEVRALIREVAPEAPMYRAFTMEQLETDSMRQLSFTMLTLGVLSVLALILGAVGLYGVLSYVVAERTREIGVRMALGARAQQVRRMVVAQGARVVAVGVAIGLVGAVATTRILRSLLFGVAELDAGTFATMSGSMVLIGLLATYVPARRASNVDPIESLRSE